MAQENNTPGEVQQEDYSQYIDFTNIDNEGKVVGYEKLIKPASPEENNEKPTSAEDNNEKPASTEENNENNAPIEGENAFSIDSFESPEKAMEFYTNGIGKESVKLPIDEPKSEASITPKEPEVKVSHSEQVMGDIAKVLDVVDAYYKRFGDWDMAKEYANDYFQRVAEDDQRRLEFDDYKKGLESEKNEIISQKKVLAAKPAFIENMSEIARGNKWGTSKKMEDAMFSPEIGGWFMHWMFKKDNPDATYKSVEDHKNAWYDWLIKFGSDKGSLEVAEKITRLSLMAANAKSYSKIISEKELKNRENTEKGKSFNVSKNKVVNRESRGGSNFSAWLKQ